MKEEFPYGFEANSSDRSAQVIQIDMGKHVAAMVMCAIASGICMGVSIFVAAHGDAREREVNNEYTVSQNHWRNIEVELRSLQNKVDHAEH